MATSNAITMDHIKSFFSLDRTVEPLDVSPTVTGGLGINNIADHPPPEPHRAKRKGIEYSRKYIEKENQLTKETAARQTLDLPGGSTVSLNELSEMNALDELSTTVGDIPSINALESEGAQQVYSTYYQRKVHYDPELTITQYREKILQLVDINQVVVIQGSTGCGKTTQVPQYILDHYASIGKHCNIVVTQPRKIAAISIAKRVCQERKWHVGTIVGYQVAMDNKISEDTRISYVTTGVMLQKLVNSRRMDMYTHIIIDEVHERDQDTDFALLVVKKLLRTNSKRVKVILMSATIDTALFSNYFSSGQGDAAPVVEIHGKSKEVTEHYIQELSALGIQIPKFDPSVPTIAEASYDIVVKLMFVFDRIEKTEQKVFTEEECAPSRGTVLIFLPGYDEISTMTKKLASEAVNRRYRILPLHSSITVDEQTRVFYPPEAGYRKVIISTNIAESSITVPDIKYVIDFCLTKSLVCDPDTNYTCLQLEWASKANCTQRKGRAGRVDIGRVYRMIPFEFYNHLLPEYGIPEIKRCPLDQTVLFTKKLNFGEPQALLALAIEPPELSDIEHAVLTLKEVGALAVTVGGMVSPYDGDLTFIGRVMASLPLDVKISKLIILGWVFNCLEDCIIIAASLSLKSFFAKPFQKLLESYKSTLAWTDGTFSDCLAYRFAFQMWKNLSLQGYYKSPGGMSEDAWGKKNYIQIRRIKEVDMLVKELKKRLENFNIFVNYHSQSNEHSAIGIMILKIVIAGAFFPNYFLQVDIDEREIMRQVCGGDPYSTVVLSGLPANHGPLYFSALQEMMSGCNRKMSIEFEEKKAYIHFNRLQLKNTEEDSLILPAVYLAVKMRQNRVPLELQVFSSEEAERKMEQYRKLKQQNSETEKILPSNRMSVQTSTYKLDQIPLPSICQLTVRIFITQYVNCGHFWVRYFDQETNNIMKFLETTINMHQGRNLLPLNEAPYPGMIVLAPYSDNSKSPLYYRATVEAVTPNEVMVFFVDYGNVEAVKVRNLRQIDVENAPDICSTPALAFECQLSGVKPSAIRSSNGLWTKPAMKWFASMVNGRELTAKVYSVIQGIVRLELFFYLDGLNVSINQELIKMGFADPAEESYASRQNYELRMQTEELALTAPVESQSKTMNFSLNDVKEFQNLKKTSHKIRLHGPFSPLEVSYVGMTNIAHSKGVKIDRDSVNSVSFNPEPQDKHPQMLVASHITLNQRGDILTARSTTLMPKIKGLPSLLCLMFSPSAELRADSERKSYTGALCGLGYDPETNSSLYRDHDIEIVFDTVIDYEDIMDVNSIRMGINLALGSKDEIHESNPECLGQIQNRLRELLLNLLKRKRKPKTPFNFPRSYCWQQVASEHILKPKLSVNVGDCPHVLPLLNAINLSKDHTLQDELKMHCAELYSRAGRSLEPKVTKCRLCVVSLQTPRDLLLHLESSQHREKEDKLINE